MAKMKVVQVPKPGADFEVVEREIPEPASGHVKIRERVTRWAVGRSFERLASIASIGIRRRRRTAKWQK